MQYDNYSPEVFKRFIEDLTEKSRDLGVFEWEIQRLEKILSSRISYAKEIVGATSLQEDVAGEYTRGILFSVFELPVGDLPLYINHGHVLVKYMVHWRLEQGI